MENDEGNVKTKIMQTPVQPKRRKTLGIRYSSLKRITTPGSEIRPTTKNILSEVISPRTPFSAPENIQKESKSTGCLPTYKLSLGRRILKKKRLEFTENLEASPIVNVMSSESQISEICASEINEPEFKKIRCDIVSLNETAQDKKHKQKVEELQQAISIWKEGFKNALEDLSKKLDPPREKAEILELLNIPLEMMKYA
ncbi:uncharacterized protein LOC129612033 [Condylostylus longicornis]|uniref:uncharacterized protein LOC129612033 n=1 Tax=Condylostylus longicornis TaxID=2530218 RepID=UPI00244D9FBD|nr:uncharacterized protein LOC129612033 [Condylostylus longicornis]